MTHVAPAAPQKEEANFLGIHDLEEDELAPVAMDIDDHLGGAEWSHEDDSGDDEDFLYGMRRGGKKSPASSYDSEAPAPKETPEPPQPGEVDTNQGPNTWIRDQFQEYVSGHVGNFLPFTKAEITAIKLMDTLKLKKAPLNAYRDLMEWHLRESGQLDDYEDLKDAPELYTGRNTLLEQLNKRYNMEKLKPYTKKIKLPVSGSVINQTLHYAPAVIQGLLTDPRLNDADYLFYDDDPLAGPPESHTYIADLNTGKAYRETYKVLKTDPTKK
jgi:hypothetical protein